MAYKSPFERVPGNRYWAIKTPEGKLILPSFDTRLISCARDFARDEGRPWEELKADGYSVVLVQIVEVERRRAKRQAADNGA